MGIYKIYEGDTLKERRKAKTWKSLAKQLKKDCKDVVISFFNSKEEVEHLLIIDKKTGKVYIAVEEKEDKSIDK
ncbi:MAG TPA: hypothetical protein PLI42_00720 [Candidatus Pacearchaeota archaeon]|nr:hypothetical protein [Candidatus Pacearchaeota archaeon]HOS12506.1 hypothetical protein [Candidatus Pacearchaeota archaeon]